MTTVYPGSVDSLPRPSASTKTNASGFELHNVIDNISDAIEAVETQLGSTPAATVSLDYVRLGDGAGKGLWVPVAALGSPSLIDNGNYDNWQRGTGARTNTTTYSTDTSYAADRMFTLPAGASVTSQQSTTVPDAKSTSSLQINGAASVTTVDHGQRIRAAYASRYRTSLLFRAVVHNVTGAAFVPNLRIGTPSAADNFASVTNRLNQALQSCADNAWTEVYHVFDPSAYTNIANGLEVCLRVPSGSLVLGDVVRIAQFDLRTGTQRMPYLPPDPDLDALRCLPYYQRFTAAGSASTVFGTGYAFTTNLLLAFFPLRAIMRSDSPTLGISAAGDFGVPPSAGTVSSIGYSGGRHGGRLDVTTSASALTAGNAYQLQAANTNAWIELRADL